MEIIIKKDTNPEDIKAALKKIKSDNKQPSLMDFFGKMKNTYGDGLAYQKKLRNEWD